MSNPRTIRTWDLVYRACARAPLYDDQTMFWLILRTNSNPAAQPLAQCPVAARGSDSSHTKKEDGNVVVSCPLHNCLFSAGNLREGRPYRTLLQSLKSDKQKAVMAHANWMNGKSNKKSALQKAGLWIVRRPLSSEASRQKIPRPANIEPHRKLGNWTCNIPTSALI